MCITEERVEDNIPIKIGIVKTLSSSINEFRVVRLQSGVKEELPNSFCSSKSLSKDIKIKIIADFALIFSGNRKREFVGICMISFPEGYVAPPLAIIADNFIHSSLLIIGTSVKTNVG